MENICQYSTLIFATNVTILLIVSVVTDYWQYRFYDYQAIGKVMSKLNNTHIVYPFDTDSYIEIQVQNPVRCGSGDDTTYDAHRTKRTAVQSFSKNVNLTGEFVQTVTSMQTRPTCYVEYGATESIFLYGTYGNLFRDCDSAEGVIRQRVGASRRHVEKCFNFIMNERDWAISERFAYMSKVEHAAFSCAVVSVAITCVNLVFAALGTFTNRDRVVLLACPIGLSAAICQAVALTLFHIKSHILYEEDKLGVTTPVAKLIIKYRVYSYGWSLVLAWISVIMSIIAAWLWLVEARDIRNKLKARPDLRRAYYTRGADMQLLAAGDLMA